MTTDEFAELLYDAREDFVRQHNFIAAEMFCSMRDRAQRFVSLNVAHYERLRMILKLAKSSD